VKVFLVGRVGIEADGVVFEQERFPGRQGRLLFAYLAAEQGRAVPRDELAEALWGDDLPATWEKALTVLISKLRALLTDCGVDGGTSITSAFGCYRLDLPAGSRIDVLVACSALEEAEEALAEGDVESAKSSAALAESILRKPFVPGEDGAWVDEKRRELADVRGRSLTVLAEACLRSDRAAEAVQWAEQAIALMPFRETAHRRLMEAHIAAGNRAEALQVYERCRHLLAEELGTYPSPETETIYRELLEAPRLPVRAQESASVPPARAGRRRRRGPTAVLLILVLAIAAVVATIAFSGPRTDDAALAGISPNAVGIIRPTSGHAAGEVPVGATIGAVAQGAGSIWVAEVEEHAVARIDPTKALVVQTIQVGNAPGAIAYGGRFIWVANGLDATVSQIDPATNTVVQTIAVGNRPAAIAADARDVWVANSSDGSVTHVDARTGRVIATLPVGQGADGIALGFGSVWITSSSAATVTRIDPQSGDATAAIRAGSGAADIAAGPDSIWVVNSLDGTISRIDPTRNGVGATIPVGDGPDGIAVAGRSVWVSNELDGTLSHVDAARNVVVRTLRLGNPLVGVATLGRQVFAAVHARGVAHRGGTLTVLTPALENTSVDPTNPNGPFEAFIVTNDGLTAFRKVGGVAGTQLVPDLAVSLPTPTDGGRSYTFTVRPGIRYSNGALVKPADFRRAIERALLLNTVQGAYFDNVVGARACLAARRRPCHLDRGVKTDDTAMTVTFRLTAPDPDFLHKLALPVAFAVPGRTPLHARGPLPATGPYQFASFDSRRGYRLRRNPWFHEWSHAAQPSGYPDVIVERFQESPDVDSVLAGKADIADVARPDTQALAALRTQHASQVQMNPWDLTWFLVLNTRIAPFDDVRVRRALNFAIDRRRLIEVTLGSGLGRLTCQVLPPGLDGYRRYCPYTASPRRDGSWTAPNLERARTLVRASGTAGQRVTVWIPRWIGFDARAGRYVASVLSRLGFRARFRFAADPYPRQDDLHLQIGFYGWISDFATPAGFIPPGLGCAAYTPGNPQNQNIAEFCNPTIDRKVATARALQTTDPAAASRLWTRIDRELTDQAPWVPFANGVIVSVRSKRVGNYQYNPQWLTLFDQLWVR
jgi:YVTN family beta-propeller protein